MISLQTRPPAFLTVPLYCAASLLALGLGSPILETTAARAAMMGGMGCDGVFLFALSASNVSTEHDLALVLRRAGWKSSEDGARSAEKTLTLYVSSHSDLHLTLRIRTE